MVALKSQEITTLGARLALMKAIFTIRHQRTDQEGGGQLDEIFDKIGENRDNTCVKTWVQVTQICDVLVSF